MTDRTLREKIAALPTWKGVWLDRHAVLALLDAHTAEQPAPTDDAAHCEYCDGTGDVHRIDGEWLGTCDCDLARANRAAAQPAPDAVAEALEAAAAIADEYASENFRMATDSVLLDRMQDFSQTDERQAEGNGHSAAGIASRNISAAIRALAKGYRT